jgi:acyl carrier protein
MTDQEILDEMREELARISVPGAESAELDTTWEELDVDSLDLVEVVRALEDRHGIQVDDDKLKNVKSVGDAVNVIHALVETPSEA